MRKTTNISARAKNKINDTLVDCMNKLKTLEKRAKDCEVYNIGDIDELFRLAYREISSCYNLKETPKNVDWYMERIEKRMRLYNSGMGLAKDDDTRYISETEKFIKWTKETLPKISSEELINYIKNREPEDVIFTYVLSKMTPEQGDNETLKKIMAISSGFGKFIETEDDYNSIFAAQTLRYTTDYAEKNLQYFYEIKGDYYVKVGNYYITIRSIVDRMDFSAITSNTSKESAREFVKNLGINDSNTNVKEVINYNALTKNLSKIRESIKSGEMDNNEILEKYNVIKKSDDDTSRELAQDWVINNIDNMEEIIEERNNDTKKRDTMTSTKEDGRRIRFNYIKDKYGKKIKTLNNIGNAYIIDGVPKFW